MTGRDVDKPKYRAVISGISGQFPNASNVVQLQNNLLNKINCTTGSRWNYDLERVPNQLGVCQNLQKFDRIFFGVHSKLTSTMEPSSRLLLERSYEAVVDAGINPRTLRGRNISVYSATNLSESEKSVFHRKVQFNGFGIMGGSKAMIPNRISFFLGLTGSSLNIDSDGSGAGAALERAVHDIQSGCCEAAIVTGSALNLLPQVSYQLYCLGLLSPDGVTRSFDDNADGSGRSDSIAVMFLQRSTEALRIYQEIVSVRTIHTDSTSVNTLLYPTAKAQAELMQELLDESGLTPDDISFLEADGAGIPEVDADELEAIETVFGKRKEPLLIGSVKSNIGNAIAANLINSIIKVIIASETGVIAPNINYEKPNSKSKALNDGRICVNTELTPWSGTYTMVNSSSICGVFSSVILKSPSKEKKNDGLPEDDLPRLVIVSGRTEEGIQFLLHSVESKPIDVDHVHLLYKTFDSEVYGHLYRGYTVVPAKGLVTANSKKQEVAFLSGVKREVWWIFSGMGSQWAGMGEALLKLPVFEASIRKCDAVLKPLGYDIYHIITDNDPKMFDNIVNSFIGIAAIQIGLVDVLWSLGLAPDFIIGHSVGELGCAYADGCFTAEQMILAALSRGLASIETELEVGSMAAVGLGYKEVKPMCPPDIDVACHNGPGSSTISGPAESMKTFVANLTAKKIFAREVPCSNIAYHSRYIAPAGPKLLERLLKVIPNPNPRSAKWVSTSVPSVEWNTLKARLCSAEYHTNNLLSPVLFEETSRQIPANAICVEIAPHGLLQAILKRSLPDSCIHIPLTRRGHPNNLELLLCGIGKLYNAGLQPKVEDLYPKIEFPVAKGTSSISSYIKWDHSANWIINLYEMEQEPKEGNRTIKINLNEESNKYLQGHVINGKICLPLSLCLSQVLEVRKKFETTDEEYDVVYENVKIHSNLLSVYDNNIITLNVTVMKGSGKFEVSDVDQIVVNGTIRFVSIATPELLDIRKPKNSKTETYECSQQDFYTEMSMRGFQYSGEFKSILKASSDGNEGLLKWNDNWIPFIEGAIQLYAFGNDTRQIETPLSIQKLIISRNNHETATSNLQDVNVFIDRELNYLSAGGLEIQGLKFAVLPNNLEQVRLLSDTVSLMPNIDTLSGSIASNLRLVLQLVLENTFSTKTQIINLIDDCDLETIDNFNTIMYSIPEISLFKCERIFFENTTFNKALTIIANDYNKYDINIIAEKLGYDKFFLVFVPTIQYDKYVKSAESAGLSVVFVRKSPSESIILFRKKQTRICNVHIVNVNKNIKEGIAKIKNLNVKSQTDRIVVSINTKINVNIHEYLHILENTISLKNINIFIIQDPNVSDNPFTDQDQFFKNQLELNLLINVLTPQKVWATFRNTAATMNPRLCNNSVGSQISIHNPYQIGWTEAAEPDNKEDIVKVECATINSQDVLIANGTFYADESETIGESRLLRRGIGLEFAGVDSKGNRVMGMSCGNTVTNFINPDNSWLLPIPKSWTFEDAATVPFSYIIAYTTLFLKADIQPKESILLSNCCNGSGLALLHLALEKQCNIFVTYKTEAEKEFIQKVTDKIPSNRLYNVFSDTFRAQILLETNELGVDIVIGNHCSPNTLESFFTVARKNARVILINNLIDRNIHGSVGMDIFLKEISLYAVVPKRVFSYDSETKRTLINLLNNGIASNAVKPLPKVVYNRESLDEAFNACVEEKHLEKIVIKVQPKTSSKLDIVSLPRFYGYKNKYYLIIEGLTNFGIELIDWLITRGARQFVIASSEINLNGYKNLRLSLWKSYGAQIVLHKGIDFTQKQNIKDLFKEASTLGIIDAVFDLRRTIEISEKLDSFNNSANLTTVIADEESRALCTKLRLFVICSAETNTGSLVSIKKIGRGNCIIHKEDQVIEELLNRRKNDGLHGLFIKWGIIDRTKDYDKTADKTIILPPISHYLKKLDDVLGIEQNIIEVSCLSQSTNEVEEDVLQYDINKLDPVKRSKLEFLKLLNLTTDNITAAETIRAQKLI